MEPKIPVDLSVREANVILNALAQRPFIEVADVIGSVKGQVEAKIEQMNKTAKAINETAKPDHPSQPANAVKAA
jgi:hypothetical protein